jgi:hypothetical protein
MATTPTRLTIAWIAGCWLRRQAPRVELALRYSIRGRSMEAKDEPPVQPPCRRELYTSQTRRAYKKYPPRQSNGPLLT